MMAWRRSCWHSLAFGGAAQYKTPQRRPAWRRYIDIIEGKYDVDGLRSQAVAFARRTVGAGVWRANTISAWASRTYGAVAVA